MFERFTDAARRVVVLAQEEARMLTHHHIGTGHLLLGLIREQDGLAAQALDRLGVGLESARQQASQLVVESDESDGLGDQKPTGHLPFSPLAKKMLELALREALQIGHNFIGTEHLLIGLVRGGDDGVGVKILSSYAADPGEVRNQVIRTIREVGSGLTVPTMPPGRDAARRAEFTMLRTGLGRLEARVAALTAEVERLRALLREHGIEPGPPEAEPGAETG
jgi:ATP-dependent Clp protease ATP-binding subunit ClpC